MTARPARKRRNAEAALLVAVGRLREALSEIVDLGVDFQLRRIPSARAAYESFLIASNALTRYPPPGAGRRGAKG